MEMYFYDGPVTSFGKIVNKRWYGETYAVSPKKAITNLTYQYKKQIGYTAGSKFELDSKYLMKGE